MEPNKAVIDRANVVHDTNPLPGGKIKYQHTNRPRIEKIDVDGVAGAFVLTNVLTPEECEQYVKATEIMGYTDAPITTGAGPVMMTDVRNNKRVMWGISNDDLLPIWERIKEYLPKTFKTSTWSRDEWNLIDDKIGMNQRLRFYRYEANDYFASHYDGCWSPHRNECSHFTFIIYLNDGFEGGETTFFPDPRNQQRKVSINPRVGQALVFPHSGPQSPLHEGSPHYSEGKYKYALRSDIMYTKK